MDLTWDILYRGPLESCNYDCSYCPFAKRIDTSTQRDQDREKLERFVEWVENQRGVRIGVLITPWGEALIHPYYQRALAQLSQLPQVYRVAIQTNLSGSLRWLANADRSRLALWATWHPAQIPLERFLARCQELDLAGVEYSVGIVGKREHLEPMERLRAALPSSTYVWVNAYKDERPYYDDAAISRIVAVDPLFPLNLRNYPSRGRPCFAGETSFTVDGDGTARRCHFLHSPIGNIYAENFRDALYPRLCTKTYCTCHIGYSNLKELNLREVFGDGLLARIPKRGQPQLFPSQ